MTGKAKPKKHTTKEIAAKIDAATTNSDDGKAGLADRSGVEKGGHLKYECPLCKVTVPDVKLMQIHHEARHPKIPSEEDKVVNLHAIIASESSKPRPSIRGSHKKCLDFENEILFAFLT
ncbi:protein METHYLENE BLUE SENSITIVITY 1-like [Vigna angularis]|uniref:protein METHYLENE BLUE SENSITIVITY 1-like n=1 Tax=Phaseolus angularis TaxID=3914 RepID=UPI0022B48F24|nr:protein METHYLENE BLUE SENSITIVITY 1-like [Vigna angularis]